MASPVPPKPSSPSQPPTPRLPQFKLRLGCASWEHVARLADMGGSPGGVFIATNQNPALGAPVELTVGLPGGQPLVVHGLINAVVGPDHALLLKRPPGVFLKIASSDVAELRRAAQAAPAMASARPGPSAPVRPAGQIAPIVGIDFGTSYSSVSVAIGDRVYLIPDAQGRALHPSVVSFPPKQGPIVGWDARPKLIADPLRTVGSIKRLIGRKFSDRTTSEVLQAASYQASAGPDDSILISIDGTALSVVQVCAAVLGHVRDVGQNYLGQPVRKVVLTVPASWTSEQVSALSRAAGVARLEVVEMIPEPVAGALAYGVGQAKNEIVAVYDFGGGTFDFSVVDISGEHFRVLGSGGDAWLGGDDFDLALATALANAFWRETSIELRSRAVEWQRLIMACEQTKRALSKENIAQLAVDAIVETPKRIDLRRNVQRTVFEGLCKELVERSLTICEETLAKVGLGPENMTQIVVTGGISHMPCVQAGLARFFDREIVAVVHPDEAVALGAGLRAAVRSNQKVAGVGKIGAAGGA